MEVAAHLTDHVLPPLPIRQWVLSVPKRIRPFFHHDPALAGAVLRVLLRAVRTRLRHASPGAGPYAQIGAASFLHRFGAALNPHFHFHVVVLDGVFTETDHGVRFDEATHLFADDAGSLTPVLQRRILRIFQRRGLLEEHTIDDMLTWQGTGGFSLDASVRIHGSDRAGRERLLRYCARPPFALDRLRIEREPAGGSGDAGVRRVFYPPARPTPDGRDADIETADGRGRPAPSRHEHPAPILTGAAARSRWAQLLGRIYEVFPPTPRHKPRIHRNARRTSPPAIHHRY